jgi:uncharacterized protein (DUF2237 family)
MQNTINSVIIVSAIAIGTLIYNFYTPPVTFNFVSDVEQFLNGGSQKDKNILGTTLVSCSKSSDKITGFYRNGYCSTGSADSGSHVVCAIVDNRFLKFTKSRGNDLSAPNPPSFPGLEEGDKWCLCALRWLEAYKAGKAPRIVAESTHENALRYIPKDILLKYSI